MHFVNSLQVVSVALVALASAQTPPGSSPATNSTLGVTYGARKVTPGLRLAQSDAQLIPTIVYPGSPAQQTYTLLLVDLSIDATKVNTSALTAGQLPLAPGLGQTRTTRLHFWQAGLRFAANGTLQNTTEPVAYYAPPSPPAGDIAHNYAFYLFVQQANFQGPAANSSFAKNNVNANSTNRQSFNVQTFAKQQGVGSLVAGNYFLVQNNGTASTSAAGTARTTVPASTARTTSAVAATRTTAASTSKASGASVASFTGAAAKLPSEMTIASLLVGAVAAFFAAA